MKSRILYMYSVVFTCWKLRTTMDNIFLSHFYILVFLPKSLFSITLTLICITTVFCHIVRKSFFFPLHCIVLQEKCHFILTVAVEAGKKLESEMNNSGTGEAFFVQCDVSKEEQIKVNSTDFFSFSSHLLLLSFFYFFTGSLWCHPFSTILNKTGTRQCTQAIWSTLEYISVHLCIVMQFIS